MVETLASTNVDWVVAIVRVVLGIIFFAHGGSMFTFTEHLHLPSTLAFLVIASECFGGVALIVGLFSRLAAFGIALTMVGAIATVHFRHGLFLNWFGDKEGHGYEYHLLAIALALVVIVKGAGAFSVDRLIFTHEAALEGSQQAAIQKTSQKNMMSQPLQGGLDFIEAAIWPTQFSSR